MTKPRSSLAQATLELQEQLRTLVPESLLAEFAREADALGKRDFASGARKVGDRAPRFTLRDPRGREVSLEALLELGPVVVTFYRGAWCPYCNLQLSVYQDALPELTRRGATLVAISPQTPDNSLTVEEKNALRFPVLSDPHNEVARAYGLVFRVDPSAVPTYVTVGSDLAKFNGDDRWELPAPGTFVLDRQGVIALAHVDGDYRKRLEPRAVLDALDALSDARR